MQGVQEFRESSVHVIALCLVFGKYILQATSITVGSESINICVLGWPVGSLMGILFVGQRVTASTQAAMFPVWKHLETCNTYRSKCIIPSLSDLKLSQGDICYSPQIVLFCSI